MSHLPIIDSNLRGLSFERVIFLHFLNNKWEFILWRKIAISKHRTRPNTSEKVTLEDQIDDESNISWHWLKATSGNWRSIFPMQEETKSGWHWQLAKPRLQIFIEKLRMHEKKWMNELPNLSFWGFTKVNHSCLRSTPQTREPLASCTFGWSFWSNDGSRLIQPNYNFVCCAYACW